MLRMVYPRRPQSGHITCYLNRTYHVLPTLPLIGQVDVAQVAQRGKARVAMRILGEIAVRHRIHLREDRRKHARDQPARNVALSFGSTSPAFNSC